MNTNPIIREMAEEIVKICSPLQIFLVSDKKNSKGELVSFKLCIVVPDNRYANHSDLETEILLKTDCPVPCDIIIYSVTEWNECIEDDCTFAYRIDSERNLVYEQGK